MGGGVKKPNFSTTAIQANVEYLLAKIQKLLNLVTPDKEVMGEAISLTPIWKKGSFFLNLLVVLWID